MTENLARLAPLGRPNRKFGKMARVHTNFGENMDMCAWQGACATDMLVLALVTSLGTVLLPARGFLRRLTLANQRRGGEGPRRDAARSQGVPERSRRAQRAQRACPNQGALRERALPLVAHQCKLSRTACDRSGTRCVGRARRGDARRPCLANACEEGPSPRACKS